MAYSIVFYVFALIISLISGFFKSPFLLTFTNTLTYIGFFGFICGLFLWLERGGYFDIIGFTFGKINKLHINKNNATDEEKRIYKNFHNYIEIKSKKRIANSNSMLYFGLFCLATSAVIALIIY